MHQAGRCELMHGFDSVPANLYVTGSILCTELRWKVALRVEELRRWVACLDVNPSSWNVFGALIRSFPCLFHPQ